MLSALFALLTYACGYSDFRLMFSGQTFLGRGESRMVASTNDMPFLLPIFVILMLIFGFATFWTATNDVE
jgi:hypothetical protein